ncbi:MAG TPA: YlmC/YmxH family sporulation protein [Syntrophomonadaceae bacterium]|nr:YlmC/YmxH family sporulation protein [Syntrophomonadaceae bacterium]
MVKISDLRTREVVNILDGKKLGNITDIELDLDGGRVVAFILPGRLRGFSIFAKREEIFVPWEKIIRIGRDVILVEVPIVNDMEQYRNNYIDNGDYR